MYYISVAAMEIIHPLIIGGIVYQYYKNHDYNEIERYSTFWPRFCAPSIDQIVLWPIVSLVPAIIYTVWELTEMMNTALILGVPTTYILYSIYYHGRYGATIGKYLCKVKVVDAQSEAPISMKQAFLRDCIPFAIVVLILIHVLIMGPEAQIGNKSPTSFLSWTYLLWFIVEVLTMLTNSKRRALHDFIAGTFVVRR